VKAVGVTDILHKVGLAESPDHHVPHNGVKPRTFRMPSAAMRGAVRVGIAAPDQPQGVLLCLHGRNGDYRSAFDSVHMNDVVAAANKPIVVVGVDGGSGSYWHKRASGIDPQVMIHEELWPRIERELAAALPRAIMGWSMGGYGALLSAENHPGMYKAVVGSSPALFPSAAASSPGAFDNPADYLRNDVFLGIASLKGSVVRIDCGTNDPFVPTARSFAARLPAPNPGGFSYGFHDEAYWRSVAPAQVATVAAAFGL
jgi:S-formylglutathione hydrolase FrmB